MSLSCTSFVRVAIPPLAEPLTYAVPKTGESNIQIGDYVTAPLGRRSVAGFIVGDGSLDPYAREHPTKVREIKVPSTRVNCFGVKLLEFFDWISKYYSEPIANVIDTAVPSPSLVLNSFDEYHLIPSSTAHESLSKRQNELIKVISQSGGAIRRDQIKALFPSALTAAKALEKRGLLSLTRREEQDFCHLEIRNDCPPNHKEFSLTTPQTIALRQLRERIGSGTFSPFLLHGVTGSGKTEVYIEAIKCALAQDLDVLVIVPEIALTPQLVDRLRERIGTALAVLHSQLSKSVRWTYWNALLKRNIRVATGARSALFAPLERIGLIIVDEEHESSFKQSDSFRYHARDLALARGRLLNATVILGSATPSLETYYRSSKGKYSYVNLPTRATDIEMPTISIVDLSLLRPQQMISPHLSPALVTAIRETLAAHQQVFLLYNRRGFAHYLQCDYCAHVLYCPHCSVTLTFHRRSQKLRCHFCNFSTIPTPSCPACSAHSDNTSKMINDVETGHLQKIGPFRLRGGGTEKVIDEVAEIFPGARLARLDRDTVSHERHYREVLQSVRSGDTQILIGTQMIAKGHDIPSVTLVGVIDCDVGLHLPDFRASERAFQLLTQVAGRAGRGDWPGRVLFQTRTPNHPSIIHAVTHDYRGFAAQELLIRKNVGYPPFSRLLRVIAASSDSNQAKDILVRLRSYLSAYAQERAMSVLFLGPAPAPLERLQGQFRFHILIKSPSPSALSTILKIARSTFLKSNTVKLIFDLDPQDMM